jgi:hypothetical protein
MSAVPPPYQPSTSFATEASQPIVVAGLPGAELDAEFTGIQETLAALRSRLAEIQRDDGNVRNGVVSLLALSPEAIEVLGSDNLNPRGEWTAETEYAAGDVLGYGEETRLVLTAYTSGVSYGSTDTSNTSVLGSPPDAGYVIRDVFSGDGVEDAFTLSVVPVYDTNVRVYVDGLFTLAGTDWTLSGSIITFAAPPASGTDNIVVETGQVSEVDTVAIPDETITTAKLANLVVTTAKLAALAVTTAKIADAAITAAKIADAVISSAKLADESVTAAKIGAAAVTSAKIAAGAVGSDAIASGAVTTSKIAPSAVATDNLANATITAPKIAADAVETVGIKDGNVTTPKLASAHVTAEKLSGAQSGGAPVFGARAWVTFDGVSTSNNLTGTYNQVSTILTVSVTAHGFRVGDKAFLNFTSGAAPDGLYTVATVTDANTFTVVLSAATTSGNVTLVRRVIKGSGNVSSVVGSATDGVSTINFTIPMPNADYAVSASCISYDDYRLISVASVQAAVGSTWGGPAALKTTSSLSVLAGHPTDVGKAMGEVYVIIYG